MLESRYVTDISNTYKPHVFKSRNVLKRLLLGKILLNMSNTALSDEEIETLALGLNFIPTEQLSMNQERSETQASIRRWAREIDLCLHFAESQNNSKTIKRGLLDHQFKSDWDPPTGNWHDDDEIRTIMSSLNNETAKSPRNTTSLPILEAMRNLESRQDLHILQADKGGTTVVWATTDYNREALRHLSDTSQYRELAKHEYMNALNTTLDQVKHLTDGLHILKCISDREYKNMITTESKGSHIYFLPKIHKPLNPTTGTFAGRPIVATHSSSLHWLDKYITALTAPLLSMIPGSLRDTTDLLTRLPQSLPTGCKLLTADVDSLYPSIPWEDGITNATRFYTEHLVFLTKKAMSEKKTRPPPPNLFKSILKAIIENSFINFKNERYYHQTKGTAMGACISVFFANTYMFYTTRTLIERPPRFLKHFFRYIDDLLFVTHKHTQDDIDSMFSSISNTHIRYTRSQPARECDFLDMSIKINDGDNSVSTEPYTKPTSTGTYLNPKSCHSRAIIESIPLAQLIRIRRISSSLDIFDQHAPALIRRFTQLGYNRQTVSRTYQRVRNMDRNTLLRPKSAPETPANRFKFIRHYTPLIEWKKTKHKLDTIRQKVINSLPENSQARDAVKTRQNMVVFTNRRAIGTHFTRNIKNPKHHTPDTPEQNTITEGPLSVHAGSLSDPETPSSYEKV